jgi:hypothetical protein
VLSPITDAYHRYRLFACGQHKCQKVCPIQRYLFKCSSQSLLSLPPEYLHHHRPPSLATSLRPLPPSVLFLRPSLQPVLAPKPCSLPHALPAPTPFLPARSHAPNYTRLASMRAQSSATPAPVPRAGYLFLSNAGVGRHLRKCPVTRSLKVTRLCARGCAKHRGGAAGMCATEYAVHLRGTQSSPKESGERWS